MRLKAKKTLAYAGKIYEADALFDARQQDGLDLINRGQAERFGLEDPSTRPLSAILDDALPQPEPK